MRKMFVIPALVAVSAAFPIIAAGPAASQTAAPAVAPVPAGWLGADEIVSRLATAGWTVLKIEAEPNDANYKACVVGLGGPQVEARVDPLTGAIQSQETKECLGSGALAPMSLNAVGGDDSSDDESDDSSDDSSGDSHSD